MLAIFLPAGLFAYPDTIQSTYPISQPFQSLYMTPNNRFIFSTSPSSTVIAVFDTLIFQEVAAYSLGYNLNDMVITSDGMKAYVVTSKTDSIISLDISDPEAITQTEILAPTSWGLTFSKIIQATQSGVEYLYLLGADGKIYVYDATDKILISSVNNPIFPTFTPVDIAISPDSTKLSLLGVDGKFQVFNALDFSVISSVVDFGLFTTGSKNFVKLVENSVPSYGNVAFLLNSNSTGLAGEIFLYNLDTGSVIDADTTGGTANDPIVVGTNPSDMNLITVKSPQSGDSSGLYIYCSLPSAGSVAIVDTKGIGSSKLEPFQTISSAGNVLFKGIVAGSSTDGYVYFGANDLQSIKAISKNPQISIISPTSNQTLSSGSIDLIFQSDTSGNYSVNNFTGTPQVSISSSVGTVIKSGTVTASGQITVTISINSLAAGENIIPVFVSSGDLVGRRGLKINYETIPSVSGNFKVDFGNQKLLISFDRLSSSLIDHYNLYFGLSPDDLSGADGISSPISIPQPASGSKVYYTLTPLTNGVEIFMQVSGVNTSGLEGDRSAIISNIPEKTVGPIEMSGETGGCGVTKGNGSGGLLFLGFILLALGCFVAAKKRSNLFFFFVVLIFSFKISAQEAKPVTIDTPSEEPAKEKSDKPKAEETQLGLDSSISEPEMTLNDRLSSAFRLTFFRPNSDVLKRFYGSNGNLMFGAKTTVFIWNFELGVNLDFLEERGNLIGEDSGRLSGEKATLTMFPITIPLYLNLRFVTNQMFVPYAKFGYSIMYFRIAEPESKVSGWRHEAVMNGGLKFDFDGLTDSGGSMREFGLNHIFLCFEGGYTHDFKSNAAISFSGYTWGFGVGADY